MKQEIATKLVTALRSGEYKQSTSALHTADGYCCIGVLCALAHKENICKLEPYIHSQGYFMYDGDAALAPKSVRDWSGLKSANGNLPLMDTQLVNLNDHQKKSFAEIADIIEQHWEQL